jgi:tetratricopeptide (TPR) repeat protein
MRTVTPAFLFGLMALCLCGCINVGPQQPQVRPNATFENLAAASTFDQTKDPPVTAETHFAAGQLAESQNAIERAVAQYQQALALEPGHRPSLFRLAMIQTRQKQFDAAIATWNRYVEATGGTADAYNNLAMALEVAQRREEAEKAFLHAIALDPRHEPTRTNYGIMLVKMGRVAEGAEQLKTVLSPAQVQYNLGSIYELQGKKEAAKAAFRRAIQLDPQMVDARARLAKLGEAAASVTPER